MRAEKDQLRKELVLAGANSSEINELLSIASNITLIKPKRNNLQFKYLKPISLGIGVFAVTALILIYAQAVSPTSWLFPVQRFSDSVVIKFHPQYRATIMMQRAQQVNQLVASHASEAVILSTLSEYQQEANQYKDMNGSNYAAFEYCKANLQTAASSASPSVRQAIDKSLSTLT